MVAVTDIGRASSYITTGIHCFAIITLYKNESLNLPDLCELLAREKVMYICLQCIVIIIHRVCRTVVLKLRGTDIDFKHQFARFS